MHQGGRRVGQDLYCCLVAALARAIVPTGRAIFIPASAIGILMLIGTDVVVIGTVRGDYLIMDKAPTHALLVATAQDRPESLPPTRAERRHNDEHRCEQIQDSAMTLQQGTSPNTRSGKLIPFPGNRQLLPLGSQ